MPWYGWLVGGGVLLGVAGLWWFLVPYVRDIQASERENREDEQLHGTRN